MTNKKVVFSLAVLCTLLWGSAFPFIKIGYQVMNLEEGKVASKLLFAGCRFLGAGLIVLLFFFFTKRKIQLPKKKQFPGIVLLGMVQTTIQYIFFYVGLSNTSGVKASILNASGTFIAVILARFFYIEESLTRGKIIGCLLGFLGVIIVNLDGTGFSGNFHLLGEGFILLAQCSFAVGVIVTKKVARWGEPLLITGYQLLFGGMMLSLLGMGFGGELVFSNRESVWIMLYLSLLSAVAFTLWTKLLKHNPVGEVTIYNFLVPIFGSLLSAIFLTESNLDGKVLVAILFVSLGIYWVNSPSGLKDSFPKQKK